VSAQPFGRFGYGKTPFHDLVRFRSDGIESEGSEFLSFAAPLEERKIFRSSNMEQTVGFKVAPDSPSKFKISLTAPGFSMFADGKVTLGSTAIGAPYLTWSEGSVRQDVPTPAVSWVVLSFSPKQPAYIFGSQHQTVLSFNQVHALGHRRTRARALWPLNFNPLPCV
jgi:hypothetical protein